MPTYVYRCNNCEEQFDVEQRMADDPLEIHESCGGKLSKVFSSAGIVLKGSGFYKTDTRSSAKSAASKSSESKESKSDSNKTENTKTESKPTQKADKPAQSPKKEG